MKKSEIFRRAARNLQVYSCYAIRNAADNWPSETRNAALRFYYMIACCDPEGLYQEEDDYTLNVKHARCPVWWSVEGHGWEYRQMRLQMLELAALSAERMGD